MLRRKYANLGQPVEPREQFFAGLAVVHAAVEFAADGAAQAGDFSVAVHEAH